MSDTSSSRQWRHGAAWVIGFALLLAPTAEIKGDNAGNGRNGRSTRARDVASRKGSAKMDLLVRFRLAPGASERSLVRSLGGQQGRRLSASSRWLSVRLPAHRLAALADSDAVDYVGLDEPV